jgi:hypothetical protein
MKLSRGPRYVCLSKFLLHEWLHILAQPLHPKTCQPQNRVPPIPELWNSEVDTLSFSTSGSYSDPFSDSSVISATTVTTSGTLSVVGLPTISTTSAKQEATEYFEKAIADALEGVLPDGAIVTVTGFSNGSVKYEITLSSASATDASTAVSDINTSLSQASTLTSITAAVQTESIGGTLSMTTLSVNSNTAGSTTETQSIIATSTGQLTTSVDTSGLSASEIEEVETFFENAITEQLQSAGVLPEGSFITVTGISSSGDVSYEITMFADPSADVGSIASSINAKLSEPSTLTTIQDTVSSDSTGIVEATSVTTSGKLSVTGLSITTSAELTEATEYFETAIADALEGVLPHGAVVTVTGFSNGVVEYEISLNADSDSEASQAVSQINSSLSQPSTLTSIKNTAVSESTSSGGNLSLTSLKVNSNTAGTATETTTSKVTSTGQLTTSLSTTGLTAAQVDEVAAYMEVSIEEELITQGVLPAGAFVTVTGISSAGVVSYTITMYNDPAADSSGIVFSIESTLSQSSSLTAIQSTAIADSTGSSVATALSTLSVSGYTAGDTTGIANTGGVATALATLTVNGFTPGETTGRNDAMTYSFIYAFT